MTNYNDGKWHGWNGGECPVHPKTVVTAKWSINGVETEAIESFCLPYWSDTTICAFRVVREHREPREYWVRVNSWGAPVHCSDEHPDAFLVREVL